MNSWAKLVVAMGVAWALSGGVAVDWGSARLSEPRVNAANVVEEVSMAAKKKASKAKKKAPIKVVLTLFDAEKGAPIGRAEEVFRNDVADGSLDTLIAPPCPRTMPMTAENPSPLPVNFVVKNGSKMRARVASSMPHPVSVTSMLT